MTNQEIDLAVGASVIPAKKKRTSSGRRKIPIQKIEKKESLQVTFSKRRQGLFKKAAEISILCGAHVAVITFSPGNKPYSFGSPSVEYVLDHFLSRSSSPPPSLSPPCHCHVVDAEAVALLQRYNGLKEEKYWRTANRASSSTSGDDNNRKKYWWEEEKVELMDLEELLCFRERLMEFRKLVADPASDCVQGA